MILISWICDLSAEEYVEASKYHKESTTEFLEKTLFLMKSNPYEISTGCSSMGKTIKKRANAVFREIQLISSYLRLKPFPEMVLVGSCKPEHDTLYFIGKSIARRFDKFIIIVFSENDFTVVSNRKDLPPFPDFKCNSREELISSVRSFVKNAINERISSDIILEGGDFLWKQYYSTQFLKQRLNIKLFRKFIPKYAIKKANMTLERDFFERITKHSKEKCTLERFF